MTQNQNESLNGKLWSLVPKSKFCGKRLVTIGVCETICVSNTGAGSKLVIMERLGIQVGKHTLVGLREEDNIRLKNAAKKIQLKYRNRRKKARLERKRLTTKCVAYKAGSFGVGIEPESGRGSGRAKKKRKGQSAVPTQAGHESSNMDATNIKVIFIDEQAIDHMFVEKSWPK